LALAERLPGEPGRSRQLRHHRLAFGRVGILHDLVTAAWTEPTPWQTRPYGMVDDHAVAILERQLDQVRADQATRCRLLAALSARGVRPRPNRSPARCTR